MVAIVCMVGNDYQRIIDGVNHWKEVEPIDFVYLLFDEKKDKYGFASQINTEDLSKVLPFPAVKIMRLGYNPQSYESVFCVLYNVLRREVEGKRRKVLIDSTSTTKEAYGATVTISLMFKNVRMYIVPPLERGWYVPTPDDPGFRDWFSKTRSIHGSQPQEIYLPGQRLEQPSSEEKTVLLKVYENGGSATTVGSIIKWCKSDPLDPVTKNRFSRLVQRLEGKGFVEKKQNGRETAVSLTYFGRIFAESIREYEKKEEIPSRKTVRNKKDRSSKKN
jgi:hypothetical protein